ncbi:MAG: hypothetical protein RL354_306 [Planctomycetota bacterium]
MQESREAFPSTDRGRLAEMLARDPAARAVAVSEVLSRYVEPLRIYVRGSSLRSIGDDADLVQGFFAARFSRDGYLDGWLASGLPLRRWLINGLHLYAKEERRRARPQGDVSLDQPLELPVEHVPAADAAWARAILLEACDQVRRELERSGHVIAWDIFRRHFIDGRPYRELQLEFDMRPASMAEASRRVANLLREFVRILLVRDGVRPEEIEMELSAMLRAIEQEQR